MTLTPRQRETLMFIDAYHRANGVSPTLQKIADALSRSKIVIFERIHALEVKKLIVLFKKQKKSRWIELTPAGKRAISNPVADQLRKFLATFPIQDPRRAELTEILELAGR